MKIINFINPTNPHDIHACTIWLRFTIAAVLMIITFITYIQVSQIRLWYGYRQEYKKFHTLIKQYEQVVEEKKKLEGQEQTLKIKVQHINNQHNASTIYIEKLNILRTLCTNSIHLVSCTFAPVHTEITLNCNTIEQAQICCNMLSKNTKGLRISSIAPQKHTLQVTFKN
jgi:predicted RND superfamily exporter protein